MLCNASNILTVVICDKMRSSGVLSSTYLTLISSLAVCALLSANLVHFPFIMADIVIFYTDIPKFYPAVIHYIRYISIAHLYIADVTWTATTFLSLCVSIQRTLSVFIVRKRNSRIICTLILLFPLVAYVAIATSETSNVIQHVRHLYGLQNASAAYRKCATFECHAWKFSSSWTMMARLVCYGIYPCFIYCVSLTLFGNILFSIRPGHQTRPKVGILLARAATCCFHVASTIFIFGTYLYMTDGIDSTNGPAYESLTYRRGASFIEIIFRSSFAPVVLLVPKRSREHILCVIGA